MFFDTGFLKNDEIWLRLDKVSEGNPVKNWVPAYYFTIMNHAGEEMGKCDLRIGHNELTYFGGNIGYSVQEAYRGRHYAGKACRLLFELAKMHGMGYVIITCNPDNIASCKTCEWLGCELLEIAEVPAGNDMRERGETRKRIYRRTV